MVAWFNAENSEFIIAFEVRKGRETEDKECLLKKLGPTEDFCQNTLLS